MARKKAKKAYGGRTQNRIAKEAIQRSLGDLPSSPTVTPPCWDDGKEELRFSYYYCAKGQGDDKWMPGQVYANMLPMTFSKLVKKVRPNPAFGASFREIQFPSGN